MSTVTGGVSAVAVTSGAEVNLLSLASGTAGELGIKGMRQWALTVTTDQDITVRVYKRAGSNVGECIVSGLTTTATSAAPLIIEQANNAAPAIRVTARAAVATATVNCDFYATSVLP
jgi:hypothetical protein